MGLLVEAEKRVKATVWPLRILLFAVLAALPWATPAEEPRRLAHYSHQRWIDGSEAPAPVLAMAQGRDGFLWLATGEGLFRFDGVRFELIKPEGGNQEHDQPSALLVTKTFPASDTARSDAACPCQPETGECHKNSPAESIL